MYCNTHIQFRTQKPSLGFIFFINRLIWVVLKQISLTQAVVDPSGKMASPTGEVARIGIGVDTCLHPQVLDHRGLERSGHHDCYSPSGAEQTSGSDP